MPQKQFAFNYAVRSEVGLVRDTNQDSAYASKNLLVVADGMGGHAGGDVASSIAINVIQALDHSEHTVQTAVTDMEIALEQARLALVRASELVPRLQGLGTTVVCLLSAGTTLFMAHMGDSRAYLLRDGELMQITIDHTFVQHLIDLGRITPAEAEHHPQRNVVMRVLSDFDLNLSPEISVREARVGDRWLLCSDGLSGFVSPDEILAIMSNYAAPEKAADALIAAALANQSNDNVTCLIADIVAPESSKPQTVHKVGAAATKGPYPQLVQTVVAEAARRVGITDDIDDWVTEEIWLGTQPIDTNAVKEATTEVLPRMEAPITPPVVTEVVASAPIPGPPPLPPTEGLALSATPALPLLPDASALAVPAVPLHPEDDDPAALPAAKARPFLALGITLAALALVAFGLWRGYAWTQTQYFVGISNGQVAVFRGIPDSIGPLELNRPVQLFEARVSEMPDLFLGRLDGTIRAESFEEALLRAQGLIDEALPPVQPGVVIPSPTPLPVPASPAPASPTPTGTAPPGTPTPGGGG